MARYEVVLSWVTKVNFGVLEAEGEAEVIKYCEKALKDDPKLTEEDGGCEWFVKPVETKTEKPVETKEENKD
jgi:hypothetical protein